MDEKIIKKNAVPVIAAMITALAFSFTGLPMDGNTSAKKMSDVYNGLGCMSLLAWILLLILYVKGWEGYRKYRNWQAHVLAVIFSAGKVFWAFFFFKIHLFGGNASWNFLFYKWKLGFSVWRKETDPDLSRMLYRILYYL